MCVCVCVPKKKKKKTRASRFKPRLHSQLTRPGEYSLVRRCVWKPPILPIPAPLLLPPPPTALPRPLHTLFRYSREFFFYSPQPHLVEQMIRVSDILVFCILVPPSPPPALLTNPPTPPPNPSMIFRLFIP